VRRVGREKLQKFEIPSAVALIEEHWTPDSGLVTATMKLRRRSQVKKVNYYAKNYFTGPFIGSTRLSSTIFICA